MSTELERLTARIRACRICVETPKGKPLPHEPHPVVRLSAKARVLIAGQAPGTKVHASGAPFTDASGDRVGGIQVVAVGTELLQVIVAGSGNRVRWSAACTGDDAFAGLGEQTDVDHAGEAFPLWVSEPGIGKSDDDETPDDWFLTGTKHATSYPDPFLLRPEPLGLVVDGAARVENILTQAGRAGQKFFSRGRERHGPLLAIEEGRAQPLLQSLHAAAIGRLRRVARLRRPGEIPSLAQREEIIDPLQFHDANYASNNPK